MPPIFDAGTAWMHATGAFMYILKDPNDQPLIAALPKYGNHQLVLYYGPHGIDTTDSGELDILPIKMLDESAAMDEWIQITKKKMLDELRDTFADDTGRFDWRKMLG
jgi:hypothetical protein